MEPTRPVGEKVAMFRDDDGWQRRVRGCLLWATCGDALGAPFEGRLVVDQRAVDRLLADPPLPLRWTDDTALTLALAEHLTAHGGTVDADRLAADLAAEWSRAPHRGYGSGVSGQFRRLLAGESWRVTATGMFDGRGSYGNGAAMRVAPVGLLAGLPLEMVAELARRSAGVTHAHPWGRDGAVAQATAVALAARTPDDADIRVEEFVAALAAGTESREFRDALAVVPVLVREGAAPGEVARRLGSGVNALESVPAALVAFLRSPRDPAAVLRFAIGMGGDTDTVAAMAGAVAGAYRGDRDLPDIWCARLEEPARLDAVAATLGRLSTS